MRLQLPNPNAPVLKLWGVWVMLLAHILRERALWLALAIGAVAVALAYQSPRSLLADIGGTLEGARTVGFYGPERGAADKATSRWSQGESAIELRGLGKTSAPVKLTLQLSSGRASGAPSIKVELWVNGHAQPPLTLTRDSKPYIVAVDPSWVDLSGDVRLSFTSSTFKQGGDNRGFTADFVRVDLPGGVTIPSLTQLGWLLLCGFLLYWILRSAWLTARGAGLITLLFLLGCAGIIVVNRLLLTTFTNRLAVTLAIALLVTLIAESLTRWLTRRAGWRCKSAVSEWVWAGLRGVVAISIALKLAGVVYPSAFLVDAPFHLKRVTYMAEGRPWDQYFGESLALSVMPENEWGSARTFIPYSPFFYLVASPLARLPVPVALSVPAINAILEGLKVILVFLVGLALGKAFRRGRDDENRAGDGRTALAAGTFYALIPANFLLQQWGNWPTLLSLWLLTLWAAVVCLFWSRITRVVPFVITTWLLALTMVSYTVTAVYVGLLGSMLAVAGWVFTREERKRWIALTLSLVGASTLALVLYYGQYVGKILNETLPTFGQAIKTQGSLTTLRPTVWDFFTGHIGSAMQSYHLALIYAMGLSGLLWLLMAQKRIAPVVAGSNYGIVARGKAWATNSTSWQRIWLGAWLLTFPTFTLADFWVDQAFKQFWIALPAVAIIAGGWLLTLLLRGRSTRVYTTLVVLVGMTMAWQSVSLWVFRLLFHNQ